MNLSGRTQKRPTPQWLTFVAFLATVGLATPAAASTYYISPRGADSNAGTSADAPWKHFDHALPRLQPGDTLVLKEGRFTRGDTGLLRVNCGNDIENGTPSAPITVRAAKERRAHLDSTGQHHPFLVRNCSYWRFRGLRSSMGDSEQAESGVISTVKLVNSDHIRMRRLLVHHNNRYENSTLVKISKSHHVTVIESEFYYFHRNGLSSYKSAHVTYRRCYANSRGHADLPDGRPSHNVSDDGGDRTYVFYHGSNGLVENSISENKSEGFGGISGFDTVTGTPGGRNIRVLGSISLRDNVNGAFQTRRENSNSEPAENLHVRHSLFARTLRGGFISRAVRDLTMENVTVLENGSGFFSGSFRESGQWPSCSQIGGCKLRFRNILTSNLSGDVLSNVARPDVDLLFEFGNTWKSGGFDISENPDDGSGSIRKTTSDQPTGVGLGEGKCAVYIPEDSNMKGAGEAGADIGANILYRYEDGELTDEPLWDPKTGEFPCGAVVPGINDVPGESCFDVHDRLNVGTNGCPIPYMTLELQVEATRAFGTAPLDVEFEGSVDGGTPPYDWTWTFDDGSKTSDGPSVRRTYDEPGSYEVRAEVTDAEGGTGETTVSARVLDPDFRRFSDVDYYGLVDNWEPETPERWEVADQMGDRRLIINTSDFKSAEGLRVGESALVRDRNFADFTISLSAKTSEDLASNDLADYVVLFGWEDAQNYFYLMANASAEYSAIYRVKDGSRTELVRADGPMIPDDEWHRLELHRSGASLQVSLDGDAVLSERVEDIPRGRIGVGGYNDAAVFDDITVTTPSPDSRGAEEADAADAGADGIAGPSGGDTSSDSHAQGTCSQASASSGIRFGLLVFFAVFALFARRPGSTRTS